jgi:hypothetical protein
MPQDLKLEIDQLSRDEAIEAAGYLAEVIGKAHARQVDSATRRELFAEDAPTIPSRCALLALVQCRRACLDS